MIHIVLVRTGKLSWCLGILPLHNNILGFAFEKFAQIRQKFFVQKIPFLFNFQLFWTS